MKLKSWLKFTLKVIFSAVCLYYISTKIDFSRFFELLKTIHVFWACIATVCFISSKIIGSFRLNIYLRNIDIHLPERENLRLYWLGMFYNLFLPGGIGGDAYKIIILQKKFNKGYRSISAAILLDRISGLVALVALAVLCSFFLKIPLWYPVAGAFGFVIGYAVYRFILNRYFTSHITNLTKTDLLGLVVQLLQGACIIAIANALSTAQNLFALLTIFYISSLSTLLPLSVGGLGARELIFLFGAKYLGFPQETSVSLSLVFYMISAVVSLFGVYDVFSRGFSSKE